MRPQIKAAISQGEVWNEKAGSLQMGRKRTRRSAARDARAKSAPDHRAIRNRKTQGGTPKHDWVAPDDMPQWQVDKVKAGKMCGARKKNGEYCRARSAEHQAEFGRHPPLRCRFHGGAIPFNARDGLKPNLRHGIYSRAVLPGEEDVFQQLVTGQSTIDHEIAICKLRLRRAVEAEAAQAEADDGGKLVTVYEETVTQDDGRHLSVSRKRQKKAMDWSSKIHRIVNELVKLEQAKAHQEGSDAGPEEFAALVRSAVKEARAGVSTKKEQE